MGRWAQFKDPDGNEHGLIERAYPAWWRGRVGSVGGGDPGAAAQDDGGASGDEQQADDGRDPWPGGWR